MTIEVKYRPMVEQPVRVLVDGICNHANTDYEVVENFSGIKARIKYCSDCNAEYNDLDDRWIV